MEPARTWPAERLPRPGRRAGKNKRYYNGVGTRRTTTSCSVLAIAVAAALAVASVATAQPRPFPEPAPARPAASSAAPASIFPLRTVWILSLNNALTAPPAFDAARAYFPIEGDRIVAYDLETGTRLWIVDAPSAAEPVAGNDLLFVVEPQALTARQAADGSIAWELPFAEALAVPLTWENGWLVAATRAGTILAFRASDGHLVWQQALGAPAHGRPAFSGDRLYVPTSDNRIVALAANDGARIWERKLGGPGNEILPLDDRLYVGSQDNFFYCLSTEDGRIEWRWRTGADAIGLPVVDERTVYFVSLDNLVRALNRKSGVQRWKRALPLRPTSGPLKALDSLLVTGLTPTLRAFAARDGAPAGDMATAGELAAPAHLYDSPRTLGPIVVVVTRDVAKGSLVTAFTRAVDPPVAPIAVLPNPEGGTTPTTPTTPATPRERLKP